MIFARNIYFCPNLGGGASSPLTPRLLRLCSNLIFMFFLLKRPSTRARTVVPLTTPLLAVYDCKSFSELLISMLTLFAAASIPVGVGARGAIAPLTPSPHKNTGARVTFHSTTRIYPVKFRPPPKKTSTKGTMGPEGSACISCNSCTHAELTSGHALASCYNCCAHFRGLC